jgi:hypothetical protein
LRNADLEEIHMRKQLLLSTGIICLMLAPAVSYGQAPGARGDDQKQMRPADTGRGAASQERGAERAPERAPAAEHRAQGGREEKGAGSRQTEERSKGSPSSERPATAADDKRGRGDDAKPSERAQDTRQGGRDAQTAREGKDAKDSKDSKGSAEMKRDSDREKSRADSDKGKEGTTSAQKERETTTQKDAGRDQRDSSKNAEQGKDASKDANRPSTATDTTRTQPSNNAQTAPTGSNTQTNQSQTTQTQTNQTQVSQQSNLSTDKQVRISQTLTRERLAEPERNLNVSIRVGERAPDRVRFHRLPDTIVSIEPEYRGYDYFTTEEEIVIVEPRTHRIVSQIPRDASRIHAAGAGSSAGGSTTGTAGYTGTTAAAGGASPCRIMRRDTAGNVTELTPQTVGAAAQQQSISVTVQVPGGATTPPIPMGSPDGQIVVAGQSGADCTVTIEAQTR